jgi:ABC-type uncharacterized transport system permease subunit
MDVGANGVTEASPSRTPARATIGASFRLHVGEGIAPRIAIAIGLSLISAAVLVGMSGHNPLAAFAAMAMGAILSERAGVFAVGLEGMMLMGAFSSAVGAWASGSSLVGVGLALGGGAAIGVVIAIVSVRYRADNMVTGLTANIVAAGLTSYLLRVLSGQVGQSRSI